MDTKKKVNGRKKLPDLMQKRAHTIYCTNSQWEKIVKLAEENLFEVSPYIVKRALGE